MRDIARVALKLLVIMLVAGLCLGFTDSVTREPIKLQKAKTEEAMRRAVLPDAQTFEEVQVEGEAGSVEKLYAGVADGQIIGYAFALTAGGFGGDIEMTVGVQEGKVTGVRISSMSETPGLGARAGEESYLAQYVGKGGELTVIKNAQPTGEQVAAITAATITSKAVTAAVNDALAYYNAQLGGIGG